MSPCPPALLRTFPNAPSSVQSQIHHSKCEEALRPFHPCPQKHSGLHFQSRQSHCTYGIWTPSSHKCDVFKVASWKVDPFRDCSACLDLGGTAMEIINMRTLWYSATMGWITIPHLTQDLKENNYAPIAFIQGSVRFWFLLGNAALSQTHACTLCRHVSFTCYSVLTHTLSCAVKRIASLTHATWANWSDTKS